jgi:hypothetical protein
MGTLMAFEAFKNAFASPKPFGMTAEEALRSATDVSRELRVDIPAELQEFWVRVGTGYFGWRELYFFGHDAGERDSLIAWNRKDFWRGINPAPSEGGAVFFAETCFGEQLGFRYLDGRCQVVLFLIDTFETFIIANDFGSLFESVLVERGAVDDPALTDALLKRLGAVYPGMHYAPIVSPLLGGSSHPDNFHTETANVHFRTAIATWQEVQSLAEGTAIASVDVKFEK